MEIFAIGGGDKTPAIKEALLRTGDEKASALLIPSACSTPASYDKKVAALEQFFTELGVPTRVLHELGETPSQTRIAQELGAASLLYTIGGSSPVMLRTMREHTTDKAVAQAIRAGKVHAGVSAGALLPFELAHSCVAPRPAEADWDYEILDGLGVIRGVATAHANQRDPIPGGKRSDSRREALLAHFPASAARGFAIDNGATLVFSTTEPRIIAANPHAETTTITRQDDELAVRPTEPEDLKL